MTGWLMQDQDNVYKWSDMSTCELLFQWATTIKIQLSMMVWYKANIISSKVTQLKKNSFIV